MNASPPVHLALVGPTASGKSALALAVARQLGDIEIVSADSMQVYRGMDIGTAKPSAEEQAAVRHHLLDLAGPDENFTVARYQQEARAALVDIESRGRRALLVGGTGLYVRAVIDALDVPGQYPEMKAELEAEPDTVALYGRLRDLDPVAAGKMLPTNRRRVLRALEVTLGSGRRFSSFGPGLGTHRPIRFRMAGLWLPRAVIAVRIAERVAGMVAGGLADEVRRLSHLSRTAGQALGYKEMLDHLSGACSLEEATAEIIRRTKAFARRQRVWFRRDPRITWYGTAANPVALLPALLGDWR